jgi:glycogen debranching enzyme
MRPNQIFAVSLPDALLEGAEARAVVDAVGSILLTSYGLRSLSPDHVAYRGSYGGDPAQRDSGYHQGPVWTWLIGAYVEAHYRVYGDREAVLALLLPFSIICATRDWARSPKSWRRTATDPTWLYCPGVGYGRGATGLALARECVQACLPPQVPNQVEASLR